MFVRLRSASGAIVFGIGLDDDWVVSLLIVYFAPTIVAVLSGHHKASAVAVVNLLLAWTLIGWVVAMAWSVTNPPTRPKRPPNPATTPATRDRLEEIDILRREGAITDAEHKAKRAEILADL